MQKEIEELRAKRLNHDFFKKNTIDDDEDDNFESAFFAETLLGELGSSSGSHKGDAVIEDPDDDQDVLEGDSGASDQGASARQHLMQPKLETSPQADAQAAAEESKTPILSDNPLEESKGLVQGDKESSR